MVAKMQAADAAHRVSKEKPKEKAEKKVAIKLDWVKEVVAGINQLLQETFDAYDSGYSLTISEHDTPRVLVNGDERSVGIKFRAATASCPNTHQLVKELLQKQGITLFAEGEYFQKAKPQATTELVLNEKYVIPPAPAVSADSKPTTVAEAPRDKMVAIGREHYVSIEKRLFAKGITGLKDDFAKASGKLQAASDADVVLQIRESLPDNIASMDPEKLARLMQRAAREPGKSAGKA